MRKRLKACEKLLGVESQLILDDEEKPGIQVAVFMYLIFALVLLAWLAVEAYIISYFKFYW